MDLNTNGFVRSTSGLYLPGAAASTPTAPSGLITDLTCIDLSKLGLR